MQKERWETIHFDDVAVFYSSFFQLNCLFSSNVRSLISKTTDKVLPCFVTRSHLFCFRSNPIRLAGSPPLLPRSQLLRPYRCYCVWLFVSAWLYILLIVVLPGCEVWKDIWCSGVFCTTINLTYYCKSSWDFLIHCFIPNTKPNPNTLLIQHIWIL